MKKYLFLIFACIVFTACDKEKEPELKPVHTFEVVLSEDNCYTTLQYNYAVTPVLITRVYYYLNPGLVYKGNYTTLYYSLISPDGEVVIDRHGVNYTVGGNYDGQFHFYQVMEIPVDEFDDRYEYKFGYTLQIEYYLY